MATTLKTREKTVGRQRSKDPNTREYSGRVAARLRRLREDRGWTVETLVEKLELQEYSTTKATIYKYESGDLMLPWDKIPHFAAAFGVSIGHFLPKE